MSSVEAKRMQGGRECNGLGQTVGQETATIAPQLLGSFTARPRANRKTPVGSRQSCYSAEVNIERSGRNSKQPQGNLTCQAWPEG